MGGLTVNSPLSELKKIYGEPQKFYSGYEGDRIGIYGNNVMINYNVAYKPHVVSIHITANNGWKTPAGISVGTNISKVFDLYGQPDYSKANSTKTVCVYYPSDFVKFQGKLVPDYGLFIKYNNDNKKNSEMYLGSGDNAGMSFKEVYLARHSDPGISDKMLKTDTPIEDFIKKQAELKEK